MQSFLSHMCVGTEYVTGSNLTSKIFRALYSCAQETLARFSRLLKNKVSRSLLTSPGKVSISNLLAIYRLVPSRFGHNKLQIPANTRECQPPRGNSMRDIRALFPQLLCVLRISLFLLGKCKWCYFNGYRSLLSSSATVSSSL